MLNISQATQTPCYSLCCMFMYNNATLLVAFNLFMGHISENW